MVPGWRLLTFRGAPLRAGGGFLGARAPRRASALPRMAGDRRHRLELYIATYAMSTSTPAQREAVERQIAREYRPEFNYPAPTPETPSLKAFMLAQALRTNKNER